MNLLIVTGPTASGKTRLAVHLANRLEGEIISADSRQVYKGMDIGTGKDLTEYTLDHRPIPYHLVDIRDAGEEYNLYEYQQDFEKAYQSIRSRGKLPLLAGGTGLYIEAVLKNFAFTAVPTNPSLREDLRNKEKDELEVLLKKLNLQHHNFDTSTTKRLIRAIEISTYLEDRQVEKSTAKPLDFKIVALHLERKEVLRRIQLRLQQRLDCGMIEEVQGLIKGGVSLEKMKYYGLEYKFIAQYLEREFSYPEMVEKLNVAIRQYAKRQMTWFRGMERKGFAINWIDGNLQVDDQVSSVLEILGN